MGILFGGRAEKRSMTFPEPTIPPFPGADVYGRSTLLSNPDTALQLSAVWACVGLTANVISTFPLESFKKTISGGIPTRVPDPTVIATPASGVLQSAWIHQVLVSLLLRGNAVGRKVARDPLTQDPLQVELQNYDKCEPHTDDKGVVTWKINNKPVPTEEIWHVAGLTLPGSKIGLSPIAFAAASMGVTLAARQFATDFYDGGNPKAVLSSDQPITQEQATTVKDRFLAAVRSRQPAVLGAGLTYTPIQVPPEESQFLATQQAGIGDIARYFFTPPEMVGGPAGGGMTYSNREQRALDFLTFTVSFWTKRVEDALGTLLPTNIYTAFNVDPLLRTDAETQARIHVQQIAAKIKTPTEVRGDMNLPPMTEAQQAEADMVPLTITPLGGAKALPAIKLPPGPAAPTPKDDQGVNPDA